MKYRISDYFSYLRIGLVVLFSIALCLWPYGFGIWGIAMILIIFATDSIDGYFARKFDKPDQMGAFLDIASDRIVETTLLVPFVFLSVAHPFILIFFIAKGFTVDYFRLKKFVESGKVPFAQGKTLLFTVVKSRFVRGVYGIVKLVLIIMFYNKLINLAVIPEIVYTIVIVLTLFLAVLRSIPAIFSI